MPEKSLEEEILTIFDDEAQFGDPVFPDELLSRTGGTKEEVQEILERLLDQGVIIGFTYQGELALELAYREEPG